MQLIMLNGHRLLKKASKLVTDIKTYKRTTTNPRILKDHNKIYNKVLKGYSSIAIINLDSYYHTHIYFYSFILC